ncbi:glutathione transferase GstA [Arenibaculum sp.]|uniref:glutathione transferase GstA n=1 Tax=Arenibaculum sp. TaxID=2865862 RepID=UPI002E13DDF4|nr:glutathione transferase GstA [Arenibaculum sp.]
MKLYYTPGACSLSPHIILREIGAQFELERVDAATKTTEHGEDFRQVNPKGYVPALRLPDGEVLTEGAAVVQYIADAHGARDLAPPVGTVARARLQEHLNFVASELHKAFSPLFHPAASAEAKAAAPENVGRRFDHVERVLGDGRPYLLGETFTVADAYLFVVSSWAVPTGIGLDRWPLLAAFVERVRGRPTVRAAMAAEGLD